VNRKKNSIIFAYITASATPVPIPLANSSESRYPKFFSMNFPIPKRNVFSVPCAAVKGIKRIRDVNNANMTIFPLIQTPLIIFFKYHI